MMFGTIDNDTMSHTIPINNTGIPSDFAANSMLSTTPYHHHHHHHHHHHRCVTESRKREGERLPMNSDKNAINMVITTHHANAPQKPRMGASSSSASSVVGQVIHCTH
jgi:hypothetical protein